MLKVGSSTTSKFGFWKHNSQYFGGSKIDLSMFGGSEIQKFQVRSNSTKSLSNVPHILHSLVAQLTAHAPPPPPILSPQSQFYS